MTATKRPTISAAQVGKRLLVATRTVKKWCDSGRLKHSKTAAGEYRILPEAFVAFLREYGFDTVAEKFEAENVG